MSKEFQIKDGDLIASFDLENEGGDIDFCDLFKISNGVANKIRTFIDYDATNKIIGEQSKQISDLQSQLAEKDKEIERLKELNLDVPIKQMQFFHNQDKISFAVEQLEKARKLIDELLDNCGDKQYKVWEVFDNQIKQLKEGK